MLEIGLVGRSSPPKELLYWPVTPWGPVGVVVLYLVVVPGDRPRKGRVRPSQVTGTAVQSVTVAVRGECEDLRAVMPSNVATASYVLVYAVLVDVVSEVHD